MSSILKALQKLEQEKTPHEDSARTSVSREILRQQPTNRKIILWFWIAGTAALAVIAILSGLLLARPPLPSGDKSVTTTVAPKAAEVLQPAATAVVPPLPVSTGATKVSPPQTTESYRHQGRPATPAPAPATATSSRTELPGSNPPAAAALRTDSGAKPQQPQPAEQAETALTLSGIAWNKDSADRLAIINGQQAATGTTVSGVVVEEIMPDRVKVNSAGRSYEIFLGKPLKTN
jgi:general secretion pathway protein B